MLSQEINILKICMEYLSRVKGPFATEHFIEFNDNKISFNK
jgi:hypothetical protein